MIRFLLRTTAFLLLAAAFAAVVVDGTRSIAAKSVMLFSLSDELGWALGTRYGSLLERLANLPAAAQPVVHAVLAVPGALVLGLIGLLLLVLGRRPAVKIGFSSR